MSEIFYDYGLTKGYFTKEEADTTEKLTDYIDRATCCQYPRLYSILEAIDLSDKMKKLSLLVRLFSKMGKLEVVRGLDLEVSLAARFHVA